MQEASRWVGRDLRDKWHIDGRIARGGVGTVFAATHKKNGSKVAIKVLHAEFSRDGDTRSRFLQEGYAANQVNHPGVVRILDDDVLEDGSAFLVMELLEGELLEKRRMRKGGKLALAEVNEIADQLLDVLGAAHDKQIVHRDIKPDNLFLTKEGRLKVLDFGFAQMKSGFRREQTATGFLLGTPGFMSPEQAIGARGQIDAATDIWAVGATLFTLLSGLPVHDGESAAEMLVAAANFPARSLGSVAPELPPRLVQIVDRSLAFDKADRWPNARSMQVALRGVPGRQSFGGGSFDSGRRSVPDAGPAAFDEKTLAEHDVEEIQPSEVQSWQTGDRTVMATIQSIPKAALPSGMSRASHPADEEMPTIAHESHVAEEEPPTAPPMTPPMAPHLHPHAHPYASAGGAAPGAVHPSDDGGTMIMRPVAPYPETSGPRTSPLGGAPGTPFGFAGPGPRPGPGRNVSVGAPAANVGRADGMMFVAGPARPAPLASPTGSRVLVFIAVAVFSMIVVVVTGLLVLAASD